MNSTLTLNVNTATTRTSSAAEIVRCIACKWDLLAVLGLLASSTAYGVYAVSQMTGF